MAGYNSYKHFVLYLNKCLCIRLYTAIPPLAKLKLQEQIDEFNSRFEKKGDNKCIFYERLKPLR